MDKYYFDLYIKFKNAKEETIWSRQLIWFDLILYLEFFKKMNEQDIKMFGKSRVEYIRIE